MESAEIGIIGGTGVYDPEPLEDKREINIETPYGKPSDALILGTYQGRKVAILPRHGRDHSIPPHRINFRANIDAFRALGVSRILATAAVGSLKEEYRAGDVVVPDQFIDWSRTVHTFHDGPKVCHVPMADPFCPELRGLLIRIARELGVPLKDRGTYLKIDGPQFSTRASSRMYRQFADIIGMTCVPEAILAREREMCFAVIATVTDYDVWADKAVTFEEIRKVMADNLESTKNILKRLIPEIPDRNRCGCGDALKGADA
jgi:5'-methylthioadenosine phosphorylase